MVLFSSRGALQGTLLASCQPAQPLLRFSPHQLPTLMQSSSKMQLGGTKKGWVRESGGLRKTPINFSEKTRTLCLFDSGLSVSEGNCLHASRLARGRGVVATTVAVHSSCSSDWHVELSWAWHSGCNINASMSTVPTLEFVSPQPLKTPVCS